MALIKPTDLGSKFLSKTPTPADQTSISAVQLYERQVGSDGASGNTVFSLQKYYLPGSHTLMVFLNGQKLEVDDEYTETNALTITFATALYDTDVVEFMVMGGYRVADSELESALGQLPDNSNLIINGNFDIWQRATSQTAIGYGSVDRWVLFHGGSTQTRTQQAFTVGQTDVPGNPDYFIRHVVTSSAGASNYAQSAQRVEGVEKLSGRTATVSFYAKASAALDMAVGYDQVFGTGGSPSATVNGNCGKVSLTTSWAKYSVTFDVPSISGKTLGTGGDDFLQISFWFDAGSTYDARTDTLGQQSGTFEMAQVKLEEGSVATPFVHRQVAQELALCQRYYQKYQAQLMSGYQSAGGAIYMDFYYNATMRTVPSVTLSSASGSNCGNASVNLAAKEHLRLVAIITASGGGYTQHICALDAEL